MFHYCSESLSSVFKSPYIDALHKQHCGSYFFDCDELDQLHSKSELDFHFSIWIFYDRVLCNFGTPYFFKTVLWTEVWQGIGDEDHEGKIIGKVALRKDELRKAC